MLIKSILVIFHDADNTSAMLEVASKLAQQHNAHVAGLHVEAGQSRLYEVGHGTHAIALGSMFRTKFDGLQLSHEWLCSSGDMEQFAIRESRCHDLSLVAQADPNAPGTWRKHSGLLESILLKSGHGLVVVPFSAACSTVGNRILVAWNGTREAARATEDALPILRTARKVIVLTVDSRTGDALSVDHLLTLLNRHGINAEALGAHTLGQTVGNTLLSAVANCSCDLLVMGGYGRSRISEHLLGGPTYSILKHMTVPVLISH